jgi:hypothetical protein
MRSRFVHDVAEIVAQVLVAARGREAHLRLADADEEVAPDGVLWDEGGAAPGRSPR